MNVFIIVILLIALIIMTVLYYRQRQYVQQSGEYDITKLAVASEKNGNLCLTNKETPNRTFCINITPDKIIGEVYINNLKSFVLTFPAMDKLSDDEDQPDQASVLGISVGMFRHPFADDTVCLRNMSDLDYPQRLCYKIRDKKAYLSHPIDKHYLSS